MGRQRPAVGRTTLSREERRALKHHHIDQIKAAQAEAAEAKAPYDEARKEVTRRFKLAKADGFDRKRLERILADSGTSTRDLVREELDRMEDQDDFGLPNLSNQPDLFDTARGESKLPTAAQDEIYWGAEGYRQGLMAGDYDPPAECDAAFHQAYRAGWEKGQEFRGEQFIAAQTVISRRGNPDPDLEAHDLNSDDEDEQLDIEEQARRLARSEFMETGGDDDEGELEPAVEPVPELVH